MTRVEWDEEKNRSNQHKHGISFEEAGQVFQDPFLTSWLDCVVDGEERWRSIGAVGELLLIFVAHTAREEGTNEDVVRMISARRATAKERRRYENEDGELHA